jgi:hypothetical protein
MILHASGPCRNIRAKSDDLKSALFQSVAPEAVAMEAAAEPLLSKS